MECAFLGFCACAGLSKTRQAYRHSTSHACINNKHQAPVVQKVVDNAIQWIIINLYPVDSSIGFPNTYPMDSDLYGG